MKKFAFFLPVTLAVASCGGSVSTGHGLEAPELEISVSDGAQESFVDASAETESFTIDAAPASTYVTSPSESTAGDLELGEGMIRDGRLDAAANAVIDMAQAGHSLTASAVQKVLWFFGVPQTSVATTFVAGSSVEAVVEKLGGWLGEQAAEGDDRFGVAVLSKKNGVGGVAMSFASLIDLESIKAQRKKKGSLRVRGRVSAPYMRPMLLVTSPSGQTRNISPATKENGAFDARLDLDEKGSWQIEIMADGPEGPSALVNFPLFVGIPIDPQVAMASGGLETKDPRGLEKILFNDLNKTREQHGLGRLEWSDAIAKVARDYSLEMAKTGRIAHISPISGSVSDRVRAAGLELLGVSENIAQAGNAAEAHEGLMASPGHRENILSPDARSVGIGVVVMERSVGSAIIVTQVFSLGSAADLEKVGPAEILGIINAARKTKGQKPLTMDKRLSRQGRAAAHSCFDRKGRQGDLDLGRYRSIAEVRLMTNDLRPESYTSSEPLMAPHLRDVGIAVARGRSPDTGNSVLCIILLLGER